MRRLLTVLILSLFTATPAFSDGMYNTAGNGGTATNDSACAGCVGEYVSSTIASGSAISLTNNTAATVTSITLSAGDWDVWAVASFSGGGTTTVSYLIASTSPTAGLSPTPQRTDQPYNNITAFSTLTQVDLVTTQTRYSIASSTTVNLVVQAGFATSTCSAFGGIYARRRR